MNKPLSVGITGGIGSGKTIVTKLFSLLNVPTYYADERAKILMNTILMDSIIALFGKESFINGNLNRNHIASKVFSNKSELSKLNSIVHPAVALDFQNWTAEQKNVKYVIKEAALLIESDSYKQLDKLIVIMSPLELRVNRIKSRDSFRNEKEIINIIANQSSDQSKTDVADYVIMNNEESLLIPQVLEIDKKIRQN